jgi:hypothetical protein
MYTSQTIPEEQAPMCEKSLRKLKIQVNKAKKSFSKRIMNSLKIKSKYWETELVDQTRSFQVSDFRDQGRCHTAKIMRCVMKDFHDFLENTTEHHIEWVLCIHTCRYWTVNMPSTIIRGIIDQNNQGTHHVLDMGFQTKNFKSITKAR